MGKSTNFNFGTVLEKVAQTSSYWRKTQGPTPCDMEASDGEWTPTMLNGKRQQMPAATTAVHKQCATYMHRILWRAITAEWSYCQQLSFTALQHSWGKGRYVAHMFLCLPPFPVLVTLRWQTCHGSIHLTCNWRSKWWEAVSYLPMEVSTMHAVLFTCQKLVLNHPVLWHVIQHMPCIK